ncbi:TetR/AcrR family transcriptional regulator [Streptomyces flavofungini]|uniref:TetR/AcrR family transcriptional regulator n=1 Tax=Streptomyces flavofungini TaxID=68200 RepID=A0ABS0X9F8_9ACTN|nr:TetR/AcrR family transcriptional regulator [Streptomyces flavofungini]MBJ3809830.1 TetR/AcrR family transcriptional regulator [Streptomyces flavofungini]GHC81031.1 TetR family transcriptional regulator [Streptomyces flavofungini]
MATRRRRTPDEAKRLILEAAGELLAAGGPAAVQVRAVAAAIGVSDAAVNHHFGNREQLLSALLRFGGAKLKSELHAALGTWTDGPADPAELVRVLSALYADGYAELALALHQSGWRDTGSGLLDEVVDHLHAQAQARCAAGGRTPPTREAVQLTVAALHQALALEPLFGGEFRRSVGLDAAARERVLDWWTETLRTTVAGTGAARAEQDR